MIINNKQVFKKMVVKVGSNVLTREDGMLNIARMAHIVGQISQLRKEGIQVILVTSGAVAAGRAVVGPMKKLDPVSARQLWSAVGQVKLINRYADLFQEHGLTCAQVLTTKENFGDRLHYLNMRNCMQTLLENDVIPVVNENDTISVTELMFTDNDELSGLIASMMDMEALVLLSNVDGVYTAAPGLQGSELIPAIHHNKSAEGISISATKSNFGRGGMLTKYHIALKLAGQGISVFIANGFRENILMDILSGNSATPFTQFVPSAKKSSGVRKWLAHSDDFARGEVTINEGAGTALLSDRAVSLLMIGITSVTGYFKEGDIVRIKDIEGNLLGLGKASFSSDETNEEKGGKKTKPFIHYDYLYLI
jgi:glutamate 5-kinase